MLSALSQPVDKFLLAMDAELFVDVARVVFEGVLGNRKGFLDTQGVVAAGEETEHVGFAFGEAMGKGQLLAAGLNTVLILHLYDDGGRLVDLHGGDGFVESKVAYRKERVEHNGC